MVQRGIMIAGTTARENPKSEAPLLCDLISPIAKMIAWFQARCCTDSIRIILMFAVFRLRFRLKNGFTMSHVVFVGVPQTTRFVVVAVVGLGHRSLRLIRIRASDKIRHAGYITTNRPTPPSLRSCDECKCTVRYCRTSDELHERIKE